MYRMETEELSQVLRAGFGAEASVRTRRPGALFQVNLPAFLADGDAVSIYLRPGADGRLTVTDLGHTCMRLSYARKLTGAVLATLGDLAQRHGFALEDERLTASVQRHDILSAALGMVQIQSEADVLVDRAIARGKQGETFRRMVREILGEAFKNRVEFDYHEPGDTDRLYSLDAMIDEPGASIGVAIVPSTLEAERAVNTKMHLAKTVPAGSRKYRWIAVTRDVSALDRKSQLRLMKEYLVPIPKFEDERDRLALKILDLAS